MSRNSARAAGLAACLALVSASGWAQTALTVESRTVAPDEAFTLAVDLTGGAGGAAGVNLRLTGQGDGLDQDTGLSASQGNILSGHATSTNTLDSLNDFRAVVYNSAATTNFTGDGLLHTLSGRSAHDLLNGETVTFSFDAAGTAVSDAAGMVLATTTNDGVLTISTPFPQENDFPAADNNGWTFFNTGAEPPANNFFEFTNAFENTPGGSLEIINIEYRATASWTSPSTVAPTYRNNLVAHVFNVNTNKANAFLDTGGNAVGANGGGRSSVDIRFRNADGTFHRVLEHGISPGQASPVSGAGRDYTLLVDRDSDPNSPVLSQAVFDAQQFLNDQLTSSDIAYTINSYRNIRFDREALYAASTPVDLQGFDLTRIDGNPGVYLSTEPDLDPFGTGPLEVFWAPFWLNAEANGFGAFFRKPTHFRDRGGNAVWGFRKETDQVSDVDRFGFFAKAALGVEVQADTMYIAEFVMNTDIADTLNAPNYRVRVNLFGAAPSGMEEFGAFNEVFVLNINSAVLSDGGGMPVTNMAAYPRPGAPVVNRLYILPQPESVGATFQFSLDFNEVFASILNTAEGSVWLSEVRLRSLPLSAANSMARLEGDAL